MNGTPRGFGPILGHWQAGDAPLSGKTGGFRQGNGLKIHADWDFFAVRKKGR
jgi:hypothetical protein